MSKMEEWTVVSSKSRPRKSVSREMGESSNNQKNLREKSNQSSTLKQRTPHDGVKVILSTNKKEHASTSYRHQTLSKSHQGGIQQSSSTNAHDSMINPSKKAVSINSEAFVTPLKGRGPPLSSRTQAGSLSKILTNDVPAQDTVTNDAAKNVSENKVAVSSTTPNVNKSENGDSQGSISSNKKKRKSKDERRKKREEKFYQALYQNKDSHIQFVSADVIRKVQDGQKTTPSKPSSSKKNASCASFVQPLRNIQIQDSLEDFPSLTPSKQDIDKQATTDLSKNSSSTNECVAKPKTIQSENAQEQHVHSTPKCSNETTLGTPVGKEKTSATTPLSTSKGKKSKQPIIIDVSSLIVNKKKERELQRKLPIPNTPYGRVGGVLQRENFKITAGNPLDSSGPGIINRGKIRTKKKKPTKLKLSILKSRELKKMLIEGESKQNMNTTETAITNSNEDLLTGPLEAEPNDNNALDVACSEVGNVKKEINDLKDCIKNEENSLDHIQNESETSDVGHKLLKLFDELSMLKVVDDTLAPEIEIAVKQSMHNRKFRDYCDMYTSKELHRLVMNLLSELYRFQDRLYHTDPIKFKTKRRLVSGLKEALCYLNLNKVQLLIIAPDIEKNPEPGGLDEKLAQILTLANAKNVPYVFSGTKYNLGKPLKIKTPLSIISVLDKQNCEETFRALMEEAKNLRERYHNDFTLKARELKAAGK